MTQLKATAQESSDEGEAKGADIVPTPLAGSHLVRCGALVRGNLDRLPVRASASVGLHGNNLFPLFSLSHLGRSSCLVLCGELSTCQPWLDPWGTTEVQSALSRSCGANPAGRKPPPREVGVSSTQSVCHINVERLASPRSHVPLPIWAAGAWMD